MIERKKAERGSMRNVIFPNGVVEKNETTTSALDDKTKYEASRFAREAMAEVVKTKEIPNDASLLLKIPEGTFRGMKRSPDTALTR